MAKRVFLLTKQKKQNFLYGATVLMVSMIIVKIVGAIFKIPLVNILHESGNAYFYSAYTLFNTVYALTVTGLAAAVARMVAENYAKERYRDVRKLLKLSNLIMVILGTVGFVIIFVSAKGFSNFNDNPNSYWSVLMVAPAIFFCCIMASYRGYYEGLANMIPTAITQVVEVVIKLIAGLSFAAIIMNIAQGQYESTGTVFGITVASQEAATTAALPFGAAAAMLGVSVSTLVGFIYIFLKFKISGDSITRAMIKNAPRAMRTKVLLFRLIKISIPITIGAVVIQLSALIDTTTITQRLAHCFSLAPEMFVDLYGHLLKDGEQMHVFLFGCFSTVLTVFTLVPAFTSVFGKSALPNVTSAWTMRDKVKVKLNIESVIRVTMLVAAPASMGIAFMSGPILQLLFKSSQGAIVVGTPLLAVLGVAALFLAMVTPLNAIMQGIGRMDIPVKYLFTGALIKLVLNVVLIGIPSINIMGASISTLLCYGTIAFLSLNKLRKIANVKLDFISIIVKPLIAGVMCGLAAFLSYKALTFVAINSIITILSIGVGGIVYVISLSVLNAISKDDILMLPKANKILKTLEKLKIIR